MSLVLITGATGFIGSQVALRTLEAGFNVCLVVRREGQIEKLCRIFSQYNDRMKFAVVPDITSPGGFDEALQGVEYVIHVASPLAGSGSDLLTPAVKGTLSVLQSAVNVSGIRKVVITASVLSLIPMRPVKDGLVVREDNEVEFTIDAESLRTLPPMAQYHASKLAAHKAVLDFAATNNAPFDVVTIHPVFVFGRSLIQETADQLGGTNGLLFKSLVSETPLMDRFDGVHVDDVAAAHVKALTTKGSTINGVQPYLLAAEQRSWREVYAFLTTRYPSLPLKLKPMDSPGYTVDTTRAQRELGIVFRPMEEQVADVVDQQLKLRA
ncbi:hypothetical protein BDW75DRAFT_204691 [Aspergillus navahoensis]